MLAWLGVAMLSALAGNLAAGRASAVVGLLVLVGLVGGLAGAAYSSYRGLRDFDWLQR